MGPDALAHVLRPLALRSHPNLLVGLQTSDDAAVFLLSDGLAVIQTVDFFTPIVDDPFTYGAISAANSMSDVYAMGGEVLFALNIVAFPDDLPPEILSAVLAGGASKVQEAGAVIAGGHTVIDPEPKYGLSVTGRVDPARILTKAGCRVGDALFLTKPLGTGVISTAIKNGAASAADAEGSIASMLQLNKRSAEAMRQMDVSACTDITGFGLLGHAFEVAEKSGVQLKIRAEGVPLLPGARGYAASGHVPGGLSRNWAYYEGRGVVVDPAVPDDIAALLYDPQTSGGLFFSVPAASAADVARVFAACGQPVWEIGSAIDGMGVGASP